LIDKYLGPFVAWSPAPPPLEDPAPPLPVTVHPDPGSICV